MNESFAAEEELVRFLETSLSVPPVSLRHRVLAAAAEARRRQQLQRSARRLGVKAFSVLLLVNCVLFARFSVRGPVVSESGAVVARGTVDSFGSRDLLGQPKSVVKMEPDDELKEAAVKTVEMVEWELAESHRLQRDRHSAILSKYF